MWWALGAGILVALLLWMLVPTWRVLFKSCPPDARDSAAVFWAQHSSSHR